MNEIDGKIYPNIHGKSWGFKLKTKLIQLLAGKTLVLLNAHLILAEPILIKPDTEIFMNNFELDGRLSTYPTVFKVIKEEK